jgi:hypothetical protein
MVIEHKLSSPTSRSSTPNNCGTTEAAITQISTRLHLFSLNAAFKCEDYQQRNNLCIHTTNIYLTPSSQYFHGYVPYLTIDMGHLCRKQKSNVRQGGVATFLLLKNLTKSMIRCFTVILLIFWSLQSLPLPTVIRRSTTIRTMLAPFWAFIPADFLSIDRRWYFLGFSFVD